MARPLSLICLLAMTALLLAAAPRARAIRLDLQRFPATATG